MLTRYQTLIAAATLGLASPSAWPQAAGMDHSSMPGMQPAPASSGMDHSSMPGMQSAPAGGGTDHSSMPGMDHGAMSGLRQTGPAAVPVGSLPSSDGSDAKRGYDNYGIRPHMMMMDNMPTSQLLLDRFGWSRNRDGQNAREWEGRFWYGTATNRLTIKSEGAAENAKGGSSGRVEALWSHAISPFWDLQIGARRDFGTGPKRNWAAFGIEGVLPYRIELEATAYAGPSGRTALGLKAEYDLLLTQNWVLTPELEASFYGKNDPARGIGSGLSSGSASLRLRYEITRQFAPYVGVSFERKFGQTADYATAGGSGRSQASVMAGVRFWF